jgi:malonyl-ACP O-methyltransferase BioC
MDLKKIKDQARHNFSRAADVYADYAGVQKQAADILIAMISVENTDSVLDIGSGTGFLTGKLMAKEVTGVDFAEGMVSICRQNWPDHKFVCEDAEKFDPGRSFDAVVSNFTFQWLSDLPSAMVRFYGWVKEGGIFAFSAPVKGSLKELKSISGSFHEFPDEGAMLKGMPGAEKLQIKEMTAWYETPVEAVKSIKNIGANYSSAENDGKKITRAGLNDYREKYGSREGRYPVTYRVLFAVIRKGGVK